MIRMVFGSANKFKIKRIHCKTSLQANTKKSITTNGSYKRTTSPNGSLVTPIAENPLTNKSVISKTKILEDKIQLLNVVNVNKVNEDSNRKKNLPDVLPLTLVKSVPISNGDIVENGHFNSGLNQRSPSQAKYPQYCPNRSGSSGSSSSNTTTVSNDDRSSGISSSPVSRQKSDAASQTDKTDLAVVKNADKPEAVPQPQLLISEDKLPVKKKCQEEIDCETLSQDLINHLSSSDRLKRILTPVPETKKVSDYVTGLYRADLVYRSLKSSSFKSRSNTPSSTSSSSSPSLLNSRTSQTTYPSLTSDNYLPKSSNSFIITTTNPIYLATSETKSKILTKLNYDFNEYKIAQDTKDLNKKKVELMSRLDRKLEVLRSEKVVIIEECRLNDELGENVETYVTRVASPQEAAKFHLHVQEVGKITSLLLSLSGRLARVENALMVTDDDNEKKCLEDKRNKLQEQLKEAKKLKESIDRRSVNISNMLYKYLSCDEYADYDHFVNMKAKLIIDCKEITDKIQLGEDQLAALKETLSVYCTYAR